MKALAWILFFIALAALAMTWVVGEEHVKAKVAEEQQLLDAYSATVKAEKDRLEANLNKQSAAYVELEMEVDELKTQIEAADAEIERLTRASSTNPAQSEEELQATRDLITRISEARHKLQQMKSRIDQLKRGDR